MGTCGSAEPRDETPARTRSGQKSGAQPARSAESASASRRPKSGKPRQLDGAAPVQPSELPATPGIRSPAAQREERRHEKLKGTEAERAALEQHERAAVQVFRDQLDASYVQAATNAEDAADERRVVRMQRLWRMLRIQRRFRGLVFRMVWRAIEAYDERLVPLVADRGREGEGEDAASPRLSPRRSIADERKNSAAHGAKDTLVYPSCGMGGLDEKKRRLAAEALVTELRRSEEFLIPEAYVWSVIDEAREALKARPNVQMVSLSESHSSSVHAPHANRVVVVGDLHGHLNDLLHIIDDKWYRMPAPVTNKYVFNGDFVDRGDRSVEVIVLLLTLMLAFPEAVFLNRGNHEGRGCSMLYGFYHELITKYDSRDLFESFVELFNMLPLCTLVEGEVLIVHGGPPRPDRQGEQITLAQINGIDRMSDIPCVRKDNVADFSKDDIILADLMWSDPGSSTPGVATEPAWTFNAMRSNGIVYRPSHSHSFCKRNNLQAIIRSHEAVDSGFIRHAAHNGRVITVFSASNYCGLEGNDAAVCILTLNSQAREGPAVSIAFHTWCMHAEGPTAAAASNRARDTNTRDVMRRLSQTTIYTQDEVLRLLYEFIHRQRHELAAAFSMKDVEGTGTVSPAVWAEVLGGMLQVPWYSLRRHLVVPTKDGQIPWMSRFLHRFHCPLEDTLIKRWAPYLLAWVLARSEHIYATSAGSLGGTMEQLYDREVKDRAKGMSYKSFFDVLKDELSTTLPKEVIFNLFCLLDGWRGQPMTGRIHRADWIAACQEAKTRGLCVHERQQGETLDARVTNDFHLWDWWLLQRFREMFYGMSDTVSAFRLFDHDRDRMIGVEDLRRGIANLNLTISHQPGFRKQARLWGGSADQPQDLAELFGAPAEMNSAIAASRAPPAPVASSGGGRRPSLTGIARPPPALIQTWPLLESQLNAFTKLLDRDRDGKVSFRDFIFCFYIRDREMDEDTRRAGREPIIWHEHNSDIWSNWSGTGTQQLRSSRSMRLAKRDAV